MLVQFTSALLVSWHPAATVETVLTVCRAETRRARAAHGCRVQAADTRVLDMLRATSLRLCALPGAELASVGVSLTSLLDHFNEDVYTRLARVASIRALPDSIMAARVVAVLQSSRQQLAALLVRGDFPVAALAEVWRGVLVGCFDGTRLGACASVACADAIDRLRAAVHDVRTLQSPARRPGATSPAGAAVGAVAAARAPHGTDDAVSDVGDDDGDDGDDDNPPPSWWLQSVAFDMDLATLATETVALVRALRVWQDSASPSADSVRLRSLVASRRAAAHSRSCCAGWRVAECCRRGRARRRQRGRR